MVLHFYQQNEMTFEQVRDAVLRKDVRAIRKFVDMVSGQCIFCNPAR